MPNVRRLRLHQVARELKVGQTTIVEYLEKKGIKVENAPSTLIEPHVYEVLDKEFGANKAETVNIREKINQKLEAVSLGNRKDGAPAEDDADFKKEVIIKSGVISVKDEVADAFLRNVNDGTVEGLRYRTKPILTVQFEPSDGNGYQDTAWVFDAFVRLLREKPMGTRG